MAKTRPHPAARRRVPVAQLALEAEMLQSDEHGSVILVKISPSDGPDDLVAVNAYSSEEAIQKVKKWLISIDYDNFVGVKFTTHWPDVDSITILRPRGIYAR